VTDYLNDFALALTLLACSATLAFGFVVYCAIRLGAQADEKSDELERLERKVTK